MTTAVVTKGCDNPNMLRRSANAPPAYDWDYNDRHTVVLVLADLQH